MPSLRRSPIAEPLLYEHWSPLVPERDLWVGPKDSVSHFLRWPFEYRAYLHLLCGLRRDSHVMEIGCNHGRTALALVDVIGPEGRYAGFDILEPHISFARERFAKAHGGFEFAHADIANTAYNPGGAVAAEAYEFPYSAAAFDIAYAASVFTHLLPASTARYFSETARVLRAGGRALFSFFLLDSYAGPGRSAHPLYEFDGRVPGIEGVGVRDVTVPEAVIAYDLALVERLATEAGLRVADIHHGYWSTTHPEAMHEQDLLVLERVAS